MNVDAHIHFWRLARGDNLALSPAMTPIYRDLEPPDLKPHLEAAEIGRIIVVQGAETLAENLYTLGLAARFSWIAGVVGWIQPSSPSIGEEVAALSANPLFKGVRPVRDDNQSIAWMLDRRLEPGWRAVREAGLVLEFLVQNPDELPLVTHFVRTHAEMSVVLDHCAKPDIAAGRYEPWASDISELARHRNVACKFSGLLNCAKSGASAAELAPYTRHVLAAFGGDRVIWASDWPPLELAATYAIWRSISIELIAGLAPAEGAAVLGANAERIYRLAPDQKRI
jgi:L-fuconolactonase